MPHSITVSIVSHGHGEQVSQLVNQALSDPLVWQVILTLNTPETLALPDSDRLVIVHNAHPKGFGANHNAAFEQCKTSLFCVLNPDIILRKDSLAQLEQALSSDQAAVAGPLVLAADGSQEDSWRVFPTLFTLLLKALGKDTTIIRSEADHSRITPEWVAGMCMLFQTDSFRRVNGFDERFFLYYEDVDICARLWNANETVIAAPKSIVVHNAQRASHRNLTHMRWHLASMGRYLLRYSLNMPKPARQQQSSD